MLNEILLTISIDFMTCVLRVAKKDVVRLGFHESYLGTVILDDLQLKISIDFITFS